MIADIFVYYVQCADECHHRDVNHTFAEMKDDDPNPYVLTHAEDAKMAWRIKEAGSAPVEEIATKAKV